MIEISYLVVGRPDITPEGAVAANSIADALHSAGDPVFLVHNQRSIRVRVCHWRGSDRTARLVLGHQTLPLLQTGERVRRLDPLLTAIATANYAVETGEPQIRLITGADMETKLKYKNYFEEGRPSAFANTDAALIVALPEGAAIAWHARTAGGAAPGLARQCAPTRITAEARALYFKRIRRDDREAARAAVIEYTIHGWLTDDLLQLKETP